MGNELPLISVIVTTFNRKDFLKETIQSILNQTYKNIELNIVDNCSDYNFFEFLNTFGDSRIKGFQNQNHGNIAVNRNYGIKQAKGMYLAFCDDDDLWEASKLEQQLLCITKYNADLVYTGMTCFDEKRTWNYKFSGKINNFSHHLKKNKIPLSTVLVKNTPKIIFDEDINLKSVEDFYLWICLYDEGFIFKYLPVSLVRYRVTSNSYTQQTGLFHHIIKSYYAVLKFFTIKKVEKFSLVIVFFYWIVNLLNLYFKQKLHKLMSYILMRNV